MIGLLSLNDLRQYRGITTTTSVNDIQQRIAYNGSGDIEYVGYAKRGLGTSASEWIIYNFGYTGADLTSKTTALNVDWDGRAGHTYN